ncbi:MAG: hypothetical protein HYR94_14215 [Chloroflexi bacterium]|nr:hypothetical protein [Chloroflexota bacterium]
MTTSSQTPPLQMGLIDFARLVIDALDTARVEYMLVGALSLAAWAEVRSTQDVDLVVHISFESIVPLSQELEKRDMLVPVEIILDLLTKAEGDLPINAIHLYTAIRLNYSCSGQGILTGRRP